jgi:hypothetical protein
MISPTKFTYSSVMRAFFCRSFLTAGALAFSGPPSFPSLPGLGLPPDAAPPAPPPELDDEDDEEEEEEDDEEEEEEDDVAAGSSCGSSVLFLRGGRGRGRGGETRLVHLVSSRSAPSLHRVQRSAPFPRVRWLGVHRVLLVVLVVVCGERWK